LLFLVDLDQGKKECQSERPKDESDRPKERKTAEHRKKNEHRMECARRDLMITLDRKLSMSPTASIGPR